MNRARSFSCRYVLAVAGALIAATIGACSGGAEGGADPDQKDKQADEATTSTAEATSTTLSETQQVEAAFLAFEEMVDRLAQAPDPDDPEIEQRASGETLIGVVNSQTTLRATGSRAELGDRDSVQVLSVTLDDESTATLIVCTVQDITEIDPSGSSGPFIRTYWTEWTMLKVDGNWLADSSDGIERREGEHPCE